VGGWIPVGSTRHRGYQWANCASPGWLWWWRNWWNDDWQGKPKFSEKTCPSAALSTTNSTCCPDANPDRRGGKPATNPLSYVTALARVYCTSLYVCFTVAVRFLCIDWACLRRGSKRIFGHKTREENCRMINSLQSSPVLLWDPTTIYESGVTCNMNKGD
jgi:hypothetical protein